MDKTIDEYLAEFDIPIIKETEIRDWLAENYEVEFVKHPTFNTYEIKDGQLHNFAAHVKTYSFENKEAIKKYFDLSYIKRLYLYEVNCEYGKIIIRMYLHSLNKRIKLNKKNISIL